MSTDKKDEVSVEVLIALGCILCFCFIIISVYFWIQGLKAEGFYECMNMPQFSALNESATTMCKAVYSP
jgi:hypothetical protein